MNPSPVSKNEIITGLIAGLIITLLIFLYQFNNQQTKIVFCDVGQGDAAYIRIKNKIDVVIDAGPDRKILSCLGKHMPFYDRKIELVILSHPHKDHFFGFIPVFERYDIDSIVFFKPEVPTSTFNQLLTLIKNNKTKVLLPSTVQSISIAGDRLSLLNGKNIIDKNNLNASSLIFLFQEDNFRALFTGDATSMALNRLVGNGRDRSLRNIDILKIPHHGSKTGLSTKFLHLANPKVAVISVGKNNSYGHPSKEVLDQLKALKIKIMRTDINGDIVFRITNNK